MEWGAATRIAYQLPADRKKARAVMAIVDKIIDLCGTKPAAAKKSTATTKVRRVKRS
jgi:hypothetical protein